MSQEDRVCRHRTLARGNVAHVQRCEDCGCISLHLGAMSVRIDENVLRSLSQTLDEALATLRHDDAAYAAWPARRAFRNDA